MSKNLVSNGFNKRTIYHNTDLIYKYIFKIKIPKYICKNCENHLYEKCNFALSNSSFSLETIFAVLNTLKEINMSFSAVARLMRISPQQCIRLFDRFVAEPPLIPIFPEIISFDEKFLNKNIAENGYTFIIVDWLNVKIIDILSSRHFDKLTSYFSKISPEIRSKVKYITMDMYDTYLRIAKIYFNNAIIVVDSFHVIQNLIRAFDKVRSKFLRKFDNGADDLEDNDENYYLLKKGKDLLTKKYGELSLEKKHNKKFKSYLSDRNFVDLILKIDPEILKAYNLMQDYLEFNCYTNYEEAKKDFDYIISEFNSSEITSYIEFSYTLNNWKEYILNSFTFIYDENLGKRRRLSDGPIEGINNNIEKIHSSSNGLNNFNRLKKLAIYKINKDLPYKFN